MRALSILLIAVFLSPHLCMSSENVSCTTIRLDMPGKAFSKIPVYDQTKGAYADPEICYAVVAAQLRDAHRFKNGDPLDQLSAPLSIALNHKISIRDQKIDPEEFGTTNESASAIGPGSPRAAILLNNEIPVCDQNHLEKFVSMIDESSLSKDMNVSWFLPMIDTQFGLYRDLKKIKTDMRKSWEKFEEPEYFNCRKHLIPNIKDLFEVMDESLKPDQTYIDTGQKFLSEICKGHETNSVVPTPVLKNISVESIPEMRKTLDENLNVDIPTGVAYCHENLRVAGKCSASHTSIIIGRRFNNNQCEYLIRDSYGKKCKSRFLCEKNGSIWVPANELGTMSSFLYWIPSEK